MTAQFSRTRKQKCSRRVVTTKRRESNKEKKKGGSQNSLNCSAKLCQIAKIKYNNHTLRSGGEFRALVCQMDAHADFLYIF